MVGLMALWADIEPVRQTRTQSDFLSFAERIGWHKDGWPDPDPRPDPGPCQRQIGDY
ncbi:hypothetical protein ABIE62_000034 [Porphyrobacter sp. MBR-155]|jgi:hypothetical protein|uniref:hypothetical protein n=1 Tax=Porphyrobacter sp. MBR-155 TaxID=3156464 RepID=UPI0033993C08